MKEIILYVGFAVTVVFMLLLDLGIFNKKKQKSHKVGNKEALNWTLIWVGVSLLFSVFIYFDLGKDKASEFLTAYLIEKALSVDNLFVFVLVFSFYQVPEEYQHKVLFWGVLGAIIMRAIFIFSGVWLINLTYLPEFELFGTIIHLNLLLFTFGLFLVYAGIKSLAPKNEEEDFSNNFGVRVLKKFVPIKEEYHRDKFFTIQNGKKYGTLLLVVVAIIEATDLIFAIDSIPAIFAVSKDPFILYSSNIFAILGLRTMYFLLANFIHLFSYLKYGLAFILSFIGMKMVLMPVLHVPSPISLSIVAGIIVLSVIASMVFKPTTEE